MDSTNKIKAFFFQTVFKFFDLHIFIISVNSKKMPRKDP